MDYQSRSGISPEKKARARLIRVAAGHPEWALGCDDETWGSRRAQPALHAWPPEQQPLHVVEQTVPPTDSDPTALACSGLLRQERTTPGGRQEPVWLRFVAERPVSAVTIAFLRWVCAQVAAVGKTALLLVWDNASWHRSQAVRQWIRAHNPQVKGEGHGIRLVRGPLPITSPWRTPLEAPWVQGKRAGVEPARLLTAAELVERVSAYFGCPHGEPLSIPQEVS